MTARKKNLILSILTVFFADVIYFIWMPYPKSFLKTAGASTFIYDLLTNCIYFIAFAIILLISVKSIAKPDYKVSKKKILIFMAICVGVQLGFDLLKYIMAYFLKWYAPLSNDLFTMLGILALVLVTLQFTSTKTVDYKRFLLITVPFLLAGLVIAFVVDVRDIQMLADASEKYVYDIFDVDLTHRLNAIVANAEFLYEIRNAVLDFLFTVIVLFALYFSTTMVKVEDKEEFHTKEAHFVTRIAAILLLSFVICGAKVLILPQNALNQTNMPGTYESGEGFNSDKYEMIVWRTKENLTKKKKVYHMMHYKLKYEDKQLLRFNLDGEHTLQKYHMEGNQVILDEDKGRMVIDGTEIIICYDQAFAYLREGEPYVLTFEDIVQEENDHILLELCKRLLEEGRFDCFEYTGYYAMKYDPVYTEPFVQRYINKDFTTEEIEAMEDISPEYIAKIAQKILDCTQ